MSRSASRFSLSTLNFLLIAALAFFPLTSLPQSILYDSWEAKDGLPQNSVKRIIQSQDGYLWLSTEGGLSRFDGVSFTNFGIENIEVFKSNRIGNMFETDSGDLLIYNSNEGMVIYRDHKFYNGYDSIGYPQTSFSKFIQCGPGRMLVLDLKGEVMLLNTENYQQIENKNLRNAPVPKTIVDAGDRLLWVLPHVIQIRDTTLNILYSIPAMKGESFNSVHYYKADDTFWMVQGMELQEYVGGDLKSTFNLKNQFDHDSRVGSILVEDKIYLLLSGTTDVIAFNIGTHNFSKLNESEICPDGYINDFFADREGNLWFGTSTCGLIKLKPPRFSYLDSLHWNTGRNVYPIVRDSDGRILMGTHHSGIVILNADGRLLETPDYLGVSERHVYSIAHHQEAIYYSVWPENHIRKWEGDRVERIYFPDSVAQQSNAIYSSPSGKLLVGSEFGIYELKNGKLVSHPVAKKAEIGFVSTFFEETENRLWIASRNLLICYDRARDSLVFDSRVEVPEMRDFRAIEQDTEERILVGSYGYGLLLIDGAETARITTENGLEENVVSSITEDSKGRLWLTGNRGMTRLQKSEVLEYFRGERQRLSVVLYSEQSHRLRSGEFNGGIQQNKCWLGGDRYVFPSMKGAVDVDFSSFSENQLEPPVHIEKVIYSDSTFLPDSLLRVDYSGQRMDIQFTALSFVSPRNVKFKYMLEGYDEDWIDSGSERKTSYSKLPPGDYTFRVIACNDEGVWNTTGDELRLSIVPPFYMTSWFKVASILILLLLTGLIVNAVNLRKRKSERRIRDGEKQLLKALEKEQKLLKRLNLQQKQQLQAIVDTEEKERKRIAADLHDGIGQLLSSVKINLGVAREKLNQEEKEESLMLMDKSKTAIEQITAELRNISYNLLPPSLEQFGLASAIAEEVSKLKSNPNLKIHFDDATRENARFDPKKEIILFRAFQELLNNALKHAEASEMTIQLIQHHDELVLMVEDDGKGFKLQKGFTKKDSSGLKNIFSRIDFVDGDVNIDSREGSGTTVTIEIPLKENG